MNVMSCTTLISARAHVQLCANKRFCSNVRLCHTRSSFLKHIKLLCINFAIALYYVVAMNEMLHVLLPVSVYLFLCIIDEKAS